jgi:putative CocE/NonD family hydrolase
LLSRRVVLGGSAALAASILVGVAGKARADPVPTATPWAERIWGYLNAGGGVQLRYSVMLPGGAGPFPVALQYSGYDSGTIGGSAYQQGDTWLSEDVDMSLLAAGYAVMGLSIRGTGCSSGTFDFFGSEWGTDGALGVEWAAAQPWSTGRVVMYDWSWAGISQLFVASERPRGLVAIAPGMVVTDPLRDVGAPGGVPNVLFPALWWATIMDSWTYDIQNAEGDADLEGIANVARNLAVGQFTSPVTSMGHPYEDAYWKQRDLRSLTPLIEVPVLSMEDWQDEEVGPRGGYYQELLDPAKTWYVGTNGQHDIYVNDRFRKHLVSFLDHFARDADNGFGAAPRVQLWMDTSAPGAPLASDSELELAEPAQIVTFPTLPVPVTPAAFYLGNGGTLAADAPPGSPSAVSYVALPGPTVNNGLIGAITGGSGGAVGEETWTSAQPAPGEYLAFTTTPFTEPVTLSGSASLDLWISSLAVDTDLQATVTQVRPDGWEQYIQRGWLRASMRAIDPELSTELRPVHQQTLASTQPLLPGVPVLARLEVNKFTHTFRTGAALRVIIDAPSNTGDWAFASLSGALNTVHFGTQYPSRILVGILTAAVRPGPYPAPDSLVGSPCRTNFIPAAG